MATESQPLHFVLFPMMAPGHMNPMIDIGKLLARRSLIVSIITTPGNVTLFGPTIHRAAAAGLQIRFIQIRFPAAEAGTGRLREQKAKIAIQEGGSLV